MKSNIILITRYPHLPAKWFVQKVAACCGVG